MAPVADGSGSPDVTEDVPSGEPVAGATGTAVVRAAGTTSRVDRPSPAGEATLRPATATWVGCPPPLPLPPLRPLPLPPLLLPLPPLPPPFPPGEAAVVGVVTRPVDPVDPVAAGGGVWLGWDWNDGSPAPDPDVAVLVAVSVEGGAEVVTGSVGSDVVDGSVGVAVSVGVGVGFGLPGGVAGREGVGSTGAAYALGAPRTPAPTDTGSTATTPRERVRSGASVTPAGTRRGARRRPECRPMGRSLPNGVFPDTPSRVQVLLKRGCRGCKITSTGHQEAPGTVLPMRRSR